MMTPDDPRHGTMPGYNAGCREACCRHGYARWRKERNHDTLNGRPRMIDATGTRRRVQALVALGWPVQTLARVGGVSYRSLWTATRAPDTVTRARAASVAELYERMSMTLPPSSTRTERDQATRARRWAAAEGWVPPLAWDDIDDPAEQPQAPDAARAGAGVDEVLVQRILSGIPDASANRAERLLVLERWQAAGRSMNELVRLTGWSPWRDLKAA